MTSGNRPSPRWWVSTVTAATLSAGAYVAQVVVADLAAWQKVALTAIGGVATAAVLLLAAFQTRSESRARREAEDSANDASTLAANSVAAFQVALNDIFLPFSDILSKAVTADSTSRPGVQAEAKRAVVNYAAKFISADRVRACFFELCEDNGVKRLECGGVYDGRSDAPRTVFIQSNPLHRHIFDQLEKGDVEFWANLDESRPQGLTNRSYKTFISAPVATPAKVYGLLTIDALEPGDITTQHEPFIRLFAQLLAVALKGNGRAS